MPITAWVISVLALVLAPILLIRFRKRWVAKSALSGCGLPKPIFREMASVRAPNSER